MRRRLIRALLAAVGVLACATPAVAQPPTIQAQAWLLVNPATGEVLASKDPDKQLPMASTTKLMTAIVALERSNLNATLTVPSNLPGGSSAELRPGERITMRTALTGLMVGSGNDASIAIADAVGGGSESRFVGYMNAEAQSMGLKNTHFANPHGLDAQGHYSSVRDLIQMGQRAMEDEFLEKVVSKRTATIPGPNGVGTRNLESENDLLSIDSEATGIKTGHTGGAGYSLVARSYRASTKTELYVALIGSPSRAQRAADAKRLLRWGHAQYARVVPLTGKQVVVDVKVRDRPGVVVPLVTKAPFAATVRINTPLSRTVVMPAELRGSVAAGTEVGEVRIIAGDRIIGTRKLIVDQDVAAPSVMERIRSGVSRVL